MTVRLRSKVIKKEISALVLLSMILFFGICLSGEISEYIKDGIRLATELVIPTSFPFMIISDVYVYYGKPGDIRLLRKAFTAIFGISDTDLPAFICGNICGFPIGAKMVADIYSLGRISKDEAERLLPLCNNPSCAFIIGGVGLGIYHDMRVGILLLTATYFATALCGMLTRKKCNKIVFNEHNIEQKFDFVVSVKSAGLNSIGIISFISVFSAINGIIKKRVKYAPILYIISAFSEVTNAVKTFSDSTLLSPRISLTLTAFSLGFGGICVGMQSAVFATNLGLKMKKYYLIKLLNALISASAFSILYLVIK